MTSEQNQIINFSLLAAGKAQKAQKEKEVFITYNCTLPSSTHLLWELRYFSVKPRDLFSDFRVA